MRRKPRPVRPDGIHAGLRRIARWVAAARARFLLAGDLRAVWRPCRIFPLVGNELATTTVCRRRHDRVKDPTVVTWVIDHPEGEPRAIRGPCGVTTIPPQRRCVSSPRGCFP